MAWSGTSEGSRAKVSQQSDPSALPPVDDRLYGHYRAAAGGFDELMQPDGGLRPHWQSFMARLSARSDAELAQAWSATARMLRDNGVTHNVHGDPTGQDRPWRLDPVPLLIDGAEWRQLEQGLIQRARLFNAILSDLYGPQQLLTGGQLPAALVFGSPQFLRPLHGVPVPGQVRLHFIAIDLARRPDGSWQVISDRTHAPIGAGYALETRVVMGRVLPDLFRDCRVERLAGFFQRFSDSLLALLHHAEPRMVMLSPGPAAETYFEHAYLARYLGMPLVEPGDLTVRDRRVFLKTMTGLQPIQLIWRQMHSEACDPLELQSATAQGVPGLVQAVRSGNVVVVNALGSGLVEGDAIMPFLPSLCQQTLGEPLLLPEAATWWCGEPAARRFVLANLDRLVLRPTFAPRSILRRDRGPILPARLSAAERAALCARLNTHGEHYVAQEPLLPSSAPCWTDGRLVPRPVVLRAYIAADGQGYQVMPGGLARTLGDGDAPLLLMRQGEASKDAWVLTAGPVSSFSRLAQAEQPAAPRRSGQDLASRAADNLYWLGRYAERSDGAVRLLRSLLLRVTGEVNDDDPVVRATLLQLMVALGHLDKGLARRLTQGGAAAFPGELGRVLFEADAPNGLAPLLGHLRRTASLVRERLSSDAWTCLQALQAQVEAERARPRREVGDALQLLNDLVRLLAALSGMQMEHMTRNLGWRLLDMGRRVERARHLARLMAALVRAGASEAAHLQLLLELADSTMTYRTRYLNEPRPLLAVDLLLVDNSNPRGLSFQLDRLAEHLAALPRPAEQAGLSAEQRVLARLHGKIELADLAKLCEPAGRRPKRDALPVLMAELEAELGVLSDTLAQAYFSHAQPLRKAGPHWGGGAD